MASTVFDKYSRYYDLLYKDKDYQSEANYVHGLIQAGNPDIKSILELGCGSGIHAQMLGRLGYSVHGIDVSQSMIENACSRADEIVGFEMGDVRNYRCNRIFDAVVSLFHVASYQTSNVDFEQFVQTSSKHLNMGGMFIFDFWYGPGVLTDLPSRREKVMEDSETKVTRVSIPEMFANENICKVHFDVKVLDKKSKQSYDINEIHPMRYFFMPEIELMLRISGFQIHKALKWMTTETPDLNSWNVVVIAHKVK
jgi:SAM-dependent methyltransferase